MEPSAQPIAPESEHILIVEDDPQLRQMLEEEIAEAGFTVRTVQDAEQARQLLTSWEPHLVLSDLRLPGQDGIDLLRQVKARPLPPSFVIITAFGTIPQAVEALKAGADNFLTKPLDFDHMLISINRALELRRLRLEVQRFSEVLASSSATGMIGSSRTIQFLFYQIRQIAQAAGPVTIVGESGVGKELVAHALHQLSSRSGAPFVAVNCAGIPENLVESELFGHAPGAFTGAQKRRRGLFEEANGGVLFLDEVTELPLSMQAKLLRALQNQLIRPVGANQELQIDVRVIAATNRNLDAEVQNQRFRQDLYYRLSTFILHVPPLRDRQGDVELLAAKFLGQYSREAQKEIHEISPEAFHALQTYSFPGNVRELQNIIQHAVTFSRGSIIQLQDLPEQVRNEVRQPASSNPDDPLLPKLLTGSALPTLEEMKARYIQFAVKAANGNKRRAAAWLGIERQTLYKYLAKTAAGEPES